MPEPSRTAVVTGAVTGVGRGFRRAVVSTSSGAVLAGSPLSGAGLRPLDRPGRTQ
jgi:hypothetical protein